MPVVDNENRLVGIITVDDIVDIPPGRSDRGYREDGGYRAQ